MGPERRGERDRQPAPAGRGTMTARTISHFEIGERLGEGGIGVVYKARDIHLDRLVAIKFLHPHLLDSAEAVRRFRKEARVLSNLNHPNIATIYETGEEAGQQFIVLEYLAGGALSAKIRDLREAGLLPSLREALNIATQVAEGLAHAHRMGIVHRDIKPANILGTLEGKYKVTDFGLARFAQSGDSTVAARLEGTVPYLPPEQIRGGGADYRGDIYSFGVALFELFTGERPFAAANDAATMQAILTAPAPALRQFRPDAPAELEQLVRRLMAKDPRRRPAEAGDVARELAAIRDNTPPTAEVAAPARADATTVTVRLTPRRRFAVRALTIAALLLVAAGATAGVSRLWAMRCLLARDKFESCRLPAEKHVGVLAFAPGSPGDVVSAGLREYMVTQLGKLTRFDKALCVHTLDDRSPSRPLKLAIEPAFVQEAGVAVVDGRLWNLQRDLALDRLAPALFGTASFQDQFALALMRALEISPAAGPRRALAAGSTGIAEAFQSYISGLGRLALDEPDEAAGAFQRAVSEDPYFAAAHAGLAEAYRLQYHRRGDDKLIARALESARIAVARDDELPEGHLALGRIYNDLERHDEAVKELRRAVELMPASSENRYDLVNAWIARGSLAEAQAAAEEGVKLYPDCWLAQHDLGNFYRTLGRFDQAEAHFRRVVELAPKNSVARSNLAATLYDQQKNTEAEREWLEALDLAPSSTVYTNLGQLYVRTNCYAAAERALALATETAQDDFLAYGNLAEAYHLLPEHRIREQGLFARALKLAQEQRAGAPNDPQVARMVAFYLARLGERNAALEAIQQAIDLAPDNVHTLYRAAFLFEITGERDRALPLLERALKAGYPARELCTHPDWARLRDDARFQAALAGRCAPYQGAGRETFNCPDRPLKMGGRGRN
ncbi:MAG: protein kinase [Bryobacteraceae bacterium]|nr:protein kinase [Bryobacteraceae bacterium]